MPGSAVQVRPQLPIFQDLAAGWSRQGSSGAPRPLRRRPSSLGRDPARRRQREASPGDKLIGFVEQPLRRPPEGEVDGAAALRVVEGRRGPGFLEGLAVVVIDPQVEHVVGHHPQHHAVAEHAGLAEHAPQADAAERRELLAQELGEAVAGNHPLRIAPIPPACASRPFILWLLFATLGPWPPDIRIRLTSSLLEPDPSACSPCSNAAWCGCAAMSSTCLTMPAASARPSIPRSRSTT